MDGPFSAKRKVSTEPGQLQSDAERHQDAFRFGSGTDASVDFRTSAGAPQGVSSPGHPGAEMLVRVEPNINVAFAPMAEPGILGEVLGVGPSCISPVQMAYDFRVMIRNSGNASAEKCRLTYYIPTNLGKFMPVDGSVPSLISSQRIYIGGIETVEGYLTGDYITINPKHAIQLGTVRLLIRNAPQENHIYWHFSCRGGYEAQGSQFVRLDP